jgi:hypothetical protein
MIMKHALSLLLVVAALGAGSCQKEKDSETPGDSPKLTPPAVTLPEVTIASVSLVGNCPDAEPDAKQEAKSADSGSMVNPALEKRAPAGDRVPDAEGDSAYEYEEPCVQSTMQLAIGGQGDRSLPFRVTALRVLDSTGKRVGTVSSRMPMIWKADGYQAWDETVMPNDAVQASYKLSLVTWDEGGAQTAQAPYGMNFFVEADVLIDGVSKTIRSSLIAPEPPDMIET